MFGQSVWQASSCFQSPPAFSAVSLASLSHTTDEINRKKLSSQLLRIESTTPRGARVLRYENKVHQIIFLQLQMCNGFWGKSANQTPHLIDYFQVHHCFFWCFSLGEYLILRVWFIKPATYHNTPAVKSCETQRSSNDWSYNDHKYCIFLLNRGGHQQLWRGWGPVDGLDRYEIGDSGKVETRFTQYFMD